VFVGWGMEEVSAGGYGRRERELSDGERRMSARVLMAGGREEKRWAGGREEKRRVGWEGRRSAPVVTGGG
jgi:hypothetical protein